MLRRSLVVVAFAVFAFACREIDLDTRMLYELDKLDASLKKIEASKLPEGLAEIPKGHRARLVAARAAKTPDVRLVRMRDAYIGIELLTVLQRETRAAEDFEALRTLWTEKRARFETPPVEVLGPLLNRAMAENAYNRAQKLYRASLPYGKSSEPLSGLFYLAEAEGNLRFRDFLVSLPVLENSSTHAQSSVIQTELEKLESETLKMFQGDPSGRTTIRTSARLKEARELFERKFVDGAALALVEARNGSEDEIPAALASLASRPAIAQAPARKPQLVTVTLVRWPYT